jgi:hypothetical protein
MPFNSEDFDVDAFIVSDKLASQFTSTRLRSGADIHEIASAQQLIDSSLRQSPSFRGLREDPFTFRIYTVPEILRLQSKGDAQYYFLPPK